MHELELVEFQYKYKIILNIVWEIKLFNQVSFGVLYC